MPQDGSVKRVVIHGDLIPPASIQSEMLESLWPSLICNMCGHEFTADSIQESTICPEEEIQADNGDAEADLDALVNESEDSESPSTDLVNTPSMLSIRLPLFSSSSG